MLMKAMRYSDGETAGEDPQFGSRRRKQNFGNVEEGDDFQVW